jgi:hypothetical protein
MQLNKGRVTDDSEKFRNMAARSLRAARATSDAAFRQTCFGVAAIYKRLALEDEILKGERQRSGPRKMEQLLPQAPPKLSGKHGKAPHSKCALCHA